MVIAYTPRRLALTPLQLKNIAQGKAVRVALAALEAIDGPELFLSKCQLARIARAIVQKKGLVLKLSEPQLKFMVKTGDGVFSSAVAKFKDCAPKAKELALGLAHRYAGDAANLAGNAASSQLQNLIPSELHGLVDAGRQLGTKYATNQLQAFLTGLRQSKNGKGLFVPGERRGQGFVLAGRTGGGSFAQIAI